MDNLKESAAFIREKIGELKPEIALVLGSGLGDLGEEITGAVYIDYKTIPHFPVSTVESHKGRLVVGNLEGRCVVCMQGRFHFYEGWSLQQCVYPIQTFRILGVKNLLLTNAAGCVNKNWNVGDLMLITDHIKLMGDSPLRGPNPDELGLRFFDMTNAWDKGLQEVARKAADDIGFKLREGVYMLFGGPQFETPAEVRLASMLGADAVGMSTVPEAIAAAQAGMKTLGISCMTNMAAGILDQPLDHLEVVETGNKVKKVFSALVRRIIATWPLE